MKSESSPLSFFGYTSVRLWNVKWNGKVTVESFGIRAYRSLTVIEPENETSWNRAFSDFNENCHKDGNLGLYDYEGPQKFILFNSGKISIFGW